MRLSPGNLRLKDSGGGNWGLWSRPPNPLARIVWVTLCVRDDALLEPVRRALRVAGYYGGMVSDK
jgi:hypothetical protein